VENLELLAVAPFCVVGRYLFATIANLQRLLIGWLDAVSEYKCGTLSAPLDKSFGDVVIATNRQFTVVGNKKRLN
jgi:hypothetical protein